MKAINIYDKDQTKIKPHIVFLGFDYGYRGNSKYLFEYLIKQHPKYTVYFITDEEKVITLFLLLILIRNKL